MKDCLTGKVFRVWDLGFRVWSLGFGVRGLGFRVYGFCALQSCFCCFSSMLVGIFSEMCFAARSHEPSTLFFFVFLFVLTV